MKLFHGIVHMTKHRTDSIDFARRMAPTIVFITYAVILAKEFWLTASQGIGWPTAGAFLSGMLCWRFAGAAWAAVVSIMFRHRHSITLSTDRRERLGLLDHPSAQLGIVQSTTSPISGFTSPLRKYRAIIGGQEVPFNSAEQKINALEEEWKIYNRGRTVLEYCHSAYMQIIGMGEDVIPLLLRRIKSGDGDWIVALKYISGAKPTTPEMRGDFPALAGAWLKWGADNGFWE